MSGRVRWKKPFCRGSAYKFGQGDSVFILAAMVIENMGWF